MTQTVEKENLLEVKAPKKIDREAVRNLANELQKAKKLPEFLMKILDELLQREEIKDDELSDTLRRIHSQLNDIYSTALEREASQEILGEIKKFRDHIEGLLGVNKEAEKIDTSSIERLKRDLEMAEVSAKLRSGEQVTDKQRGAAVGYLKRMYWGNIFNGDFKKGDAFVSFLFPGDEKLSIKNLNDVYLGPQDTDEVIKQKNEQVRDEFKSMGSEASVLMQNYKADTIGIKGSSDVGAKDLENMTSRIDAKMKAEILKMINSRIGGEKDEGKKKKLEEFKKHLEENGFKITFSTTEIDGDKNEDILYGVVKSTQGSRMAREEKGHGSEYETKVALRELGKVKTIREKLLKKNRIKNNFGKDFTIFSETGGKYVLNRDLVRDVRKGKFETNDKTTLGLIEDYLSKLNILDCVKPFTKDGLAQAVEKTVKNKNLAENIGADKETDVEIADRLDRDEKDENYTSKHHFHEQSLKINNAAYISIDALDIGVDQYLEFESLVQDLEAADDSSKEAVYKDISLRAGDQTTEKLRKFSEIVNQVIREKNLAGENEPTLGLIGGDEITLAFDMDKISQEEIDELMFEIKDRLRENKDGDKSAPIEIRTIKTVVSQARKEVGLDATDEDKIEAHLAALKRAENGAELLKEIEKFVRQMNDLIEIKGEDKARELLEEIPGLFYLEGKQIKCDFSVAELDGKLMLVNREKGSEFNSFTYTEADEVKNKLESIFKEKKTAKKPKKAA